MLRMRFVARCVVTTALAAVFTGCGESVLVKSYPAGAKAYLDGQYIGTTPATAEVPRAKVTDPHLYRVEYRNCDPAEGQLRRGIAGGRVFSYIITAGIVAAFRGPYYYLPVDVALTGGDCEPRGAAAKPATPGITVQQIVGDRNAAGAAAEEQSKTQRLAERLTTLRDLYNRKLISQEVFDQEMQKAVKELSE